MKKTIVFMLIFALIISVPAKADEEIVDREAIENAAPDEASRLLGGIDDAANTESALASLWESFIDSVENSVSDVLLRAFGLIAVSLICGVLSVFREGRVVPDWIELSGCAAISLLCLGDIGAYMRMCENALNDISSFSQTLLPSLCTLAAASGAISSAAVKYAASAFFMDIFITAAQGLIAPLIFAFIAVSLAGAAFGGAALSRLAKLLKRICVIGMTLLASGFTAYLGISSAISGAGDALTLKLTKTALSTALPVVGSVVSDAASSFIGGLELLKSSVGVFGMLVVAFICAAPFAALGLNYLAYKLASAAVSMISGERLSKLTDAFGDAFGMMLGLVGCSGIMMFISIISAIKAVIP